MSAIYIHDIEQGTPEWFGLRVGIPTASRFDAIVTPARGDLSKQSEGYMRELLAEWLSGKPAESYTTGWMQRGVEMEAEAREYYAFVRDVDVLRAGFVYADDRRLYGCSPDGLPGDGLLEIKSPAPKTHIGYLLDGSLPLDYRAQVQGSLLVTGRDWCDFLSYCPGLPPLLLRVERDEKYIAKLREGIESFLTAMLAMRETLTGKGYAPIREAS